VFLLDGPVDDDMLGRGEELEVYAMRMKVASLEDVLTQKVLALSGMLLAVLTPTVLVIRARYRHVVAGALVLAMLLGLLAAAVHRYGYPATVAFVVGPTPSAIADAVTPR